MKVFLPAFQAVSDRLRLGVAAIFAMLFVVAAANGSPITFAQFDEAGSTSTEPFTFTNGAASSTFDGTTQGQLTFLIAGLPAGPQPATITLTSSAVSQAETGGPFLDQPLDGSDNTLSFTRISDGANLLTLNFTGGFLGFNGGSSSSLSGETTSGNIVTYTSDFLNFSGTTSRSFQVNASANPGFTQNGNGFANTFTSDLSGGFSSDASPTPVPEPASATVALLATALFALRRKRARVA